MQAMSTTLAHVPAAPPHDGAVPRWELLIDIFAEPVRAGRALAAAPSWVLPVLLLAAVNFSQLFLSYAPSLEPAKLVLSFLLGAVPLLIALGFTTLLVAGALAAAGARQASFGASFAAIAHVWLVTGILRLAMNAAAVMAGKEVASPGDPPFSSLSFLASPVDDAPLHHLLASVNLFSAVECVLLTLVLAAVHGKSRSTVFMVLAALWTASLMVTTGIKIAVSP